MGGHNGPTGMFTDLAVKRAGGAAQARIRTTVANTDPKADLTDSVAIKYTLDPVDDLVPGTYVINVEFGDAGRGPGNPPEPPYVDYRAPSVAVATRSPRGCTRSTTARPSTTRRSSRRSKSRRCPPCTGNIPVQGIY
jgi:hypothetical protein